MSRWPCTCLDFNQVAGVHAKNYIPPPPLNDYDAASALQCFGSEGNNQDSHVSSPFAAHLDLQVITHHKKGYKSSSVIFYNFVKV